MIDREIARAEALRFSGLRKFPEFDAGISELITAMQAADSEAHARYVAKDLAQTSEYCPVPESVRAALFNTSKKEIKQRGCKACEFTGWRPFWMLVSKEGDASWSFVKKERVEDRATADEMRPKLGPSQSLYEMREPCNCRPPVPVAA